MVTKADILFSIASTLITPYEGWYTVGYVDPVGIPTAGVGHTGKDVQVGKKYSADTIELWFLKDLNEAEKVVDRCVKVELNDNQKAALMSFAFNVGAGKKGVKDGFCVLKSGRLPTFLKKINAGDIHSGCTALLQWDKAGGKRLRGLTKRRKAELATCTKETIDLV